MHKNNSVGHQKNWSKDDEKQPIKKPTIVEPLPESTRPRQDGPGGN